MTWRGPFQGLRRALSDHLIVTITVVSVVILFVELPTRYGVSWHYFADAARLLTNSAGKKVKGPGGLHLYAHHREFQFGPLSIVVAAGIIKLFNTRARHAAQLILSAIGMVSVALVVSIARHRARARNVSVPAVSLLIAAVLVILSWYELSLNATHLDDGIALGALALAMWALINEHSEWIVVAGLAVAAASKPWAILFVPLVLALPHGKRLRAAALVVGFVAATWLPFVVVEPMTLNVSKYTIANAADSALRVLGITNKSTPGWDRIAQVVLGCSIAALAIQRRRWAGGILAAVAVRLLLDPGTHTYYTVGLVLAALIWDVCERPGRVPLVAVITCVLLTASTDHLFNSTTRGVLRLLVTLGCIILVFVHRRTVSAQFAMARPSPDRGLPG